MVHIDVKLSGLTGYKLSVQLKKHQGTHSVMAFLTSIPILFCARTISIVEDASHFVGKEELYGALIARKITDRKLSISSHNDGSGNPNKPTDRIVNLSDWFDVEENSSTEPKMPKASDLQEIPETVDMLKHLCLRYNGALIQEEKDADEKYERLMKILKSERETNPDDLAVTFAGTQTMGTGAKAYGGCDINALNKANACAIVHTQSKYALVKLYHGKIDEEKEPAIDITAGIVLEKVRDVIESKIYDPDNMDKMYIDYVEQDELMNLVTPEGRVKFKEDSCVDNNELLRRERAIVEQRECFENKVVLNTAFNHDGTINMEKSVSCLMARIKDNHQMRIQEEKDSNDTKLPADENLEQRLKHLIYSCYQKKTNPYGFKFMCLKNAFMRSIGIHNPRKFFSRMTRENFIAFHEKYKEEILSMVLKKIPLNGLMNEVVSEVMGSALLPKISTTSLKEGQNNSEENVLKEAEKIVRNYSKSLASKAIESLGFYRPISDDIVNNSLQKYELVHLHEKDETNFLLRVRGSGNNGMSSNVWVKYNKESNAFVEGCSLEEAKYSYAQHKEELCCFDDVAFSTITFGPYKRKADEPANNDADENANEKKKKLKALVKLDHKKIYEDITDESEKTTQQRKETLKRVSEMLAKQLEKVRQYKDAVLNETSASLGRRLCEGNSGITNLADPNRPIELKEKIDSFYTDIQTDALEALENVEIEQPERVLCTIFRSCYELTVKNFEKEQRRMDAALNNVGSPKMRSSDNTELREKINNIHHRDYEQKLNIYSREIANTIYNQMGDVSYNPKDIKGFTQDDLIDTCAYSWLIDEKGKSWLARHSESDQKKCIAQVNIINFIKTASELSYKMCASNPPMILKWVEGDEELEGKAYTKEMQVDFWTVFVKGGIGDIIDYTVWPTVWLTGGEKGDVIMTKGVLNVISQNK